MSSKGQEQLREHLFEQLSFMDGVLAKGNVPLPKRPDIALKFYIDRCLYVNDKYENPYEKQWFWALYTWTRVWYKKKYGKERIEPQADKMPTLAYYRGALWKLYVPTSITLPTREDGINPLIFPKKVLPEENIFEWIEEDFPKKEMNTSEKKQFQDETQNIVSKIRRIRLNLDFSPTMQQAEQYKESLLLNLNRVVQDFSSELDEQIEHGVWHTVFSVELAFKSYLSLHGSVEYTHNLKKLHKQAREAGLKASLKTFISQLPSSGAAIKARYGTGARVSPKERFDYYTIALNIIAQITDELGITEPFKKALTEKGLEFGIQPLGQVMGWNKEFE